MIDRTGVLCTKPVVSEWDSQIERGDCNAAALSVPDIIERLKAAGLRPTRQRIGLAQLTIGQGNRHVTAEQLHREAESLSLSISLATVYNTLHQFTKAGLLHEVIVDSNRSYFDSNTKPHGHFYLAEEGLLQDIEEERFSLLSALYALPIMKEYEDQNNKIEVARADVIVRLRVRDSREQTKKPALGS